MSITSVESYPTVDVIIPFCEKFTSRDSLAEAIESVEAQSVQTNIILIEDQIPKGISSARNRGLKQSTTQYIAFLDADDLWSSNKLSRQIDKMRETSCGLCVEGDPMDTDTFIRGLLFGNLGALTSSIVIDAKQVDVTFRTELDRFEDFMFMIEAAIQSDVCFCHNLTTVRKDNHKVGLSSLGTPEMFFESRLSIAEILETYPETEQYADKLRYLAYYGLARQQQFRGKYMQSVPNFANSLKYGYGIKPIVFGMKSIALAPVAKIPSL